ncbi:MAG: ceaC [Myxococcales bacterium]|nr:ceaC [Myxococcales bacterium]
MGIGERDVGRGRGVKHGDEHDQQHEQAEQAQLDHMRLLAMRKRQVQRKAARSAASSAKIPESGGAALASDLRGRMEPQLGADLSHVKVHTGGEAATAAEKLGARAFTTGGDVHFGAGEFAPGTKEGDRLIAHELTHAVQAQKSGVQRKAVEAEHGVEEHEHDVSEPGESAEQEADAVADVAADNLHGGGKKINRDPAGKEAAPQVGAKLSGRTIFRSKKDKKDEAPKSRLGAPGQHQPAPKTLPAFPKAERASPKTSVQGGGGMRKRWKDGEGNIYEWDSQHAAVEKYNSRGVHLGEFDPNTGAQTKPADKTRKVEP